ncbi:MAG: hypothetical protein KJ698_03290 [Actinobacteria bacterium]|nr:hypothetical protein [Actinomycetota bacterium]MBU1493783.1 hypothetical protein [Actinomycetota bacterium]MBU1865887.1 hypothetical protein [Actinomycetota bacterium]
MRSIRMLALVAAVALMVAACGDDDAGEPATSSSSTATTEQTTPASSTAAPTTVAETTTAAPTTTTTTAPLDAHPIFGLSWAAVWPADGATAVYRIHDWSGAEEDVPARFDVGVDFRGETFDRITIGTAGGGSNAMEVYLDRSIPWMVGIKAVVTYGPHVAAGPAITEMFEEPVFFDGTLPVGDSAPVETEVILDFGNDQDSFPATYAFVVREVGVTVEVPLGTVTNTLYAQGSVTGEEFIGGTEPFAADMWLHPQHMIVKMTGSPSFDMFEIVEAWG